MKKSVTGFTIVELLIVVVVIAILASISVVAYSGVQEQARRSARLSELSQIQKSIQVEALQLNGVTLQLAIPAAYTTAFVDMPLAQPMTNIQELTMYAVFDTDSVLGTDYIEIAKLLPNGVPNNVFLRTSTSTYMGSRIDTQSQTNVTGTITTPIRNTTGRHIGWIATKPTGFDLNFDNHTATSYTLQAHSGWNFTDVRLNDKRGGVAVLVFSEYHDETTRQQVMQWLDRKYNIGFYS